MKKKNIKNYPRIGILGGTFDPPHKGHIYISKIALKKLKLKKILWIVTKKNPLKRKPILDLKKRIKLCKKAVSKDKKIFVKYFDNVTKTSNTFNLLKYIKKKNKQSGLFFLIGADNLKKFHKWKSWRIIPKLANIVGVPRKNSSLSSKATKKLNKKDFIYIKSRKINISSSIIRKFW